MSDLQWRTRVETRDEKYLYLILDSDRHPDTYRLQVRSLDKNKLEHEGNSFLTLDTAKAAAERWRIGHGTAAKVGAR